MESSGATSSSSPSLEVCPFFQKGQCQLGNACLLLHQVSRAPCIFFALGGCGNGESCTFAHLTPTSNKAETSVQARVVPIRVESKQLRVCTFWAENACKKGDKCRFSHSVESSSSSQDTSTLRRRSPLLFQPATTLSISRDDPSNNVDAGRESDETGSVKSATSDELSFNQPADPMINESKDEIELSCDAKKPDNYEMSNEEASATQLPEHVIDDADNVDKEEVSGPSCNDDHGDPEMSLADPFRDDNTEAEAPSDKSEPTLREREANYLPEDSFDRTTVTTTERDTDVQNQHTPADMDSFNPSKALGDIALVPGNIMQHWSNYANPAADLSVPFCRYHSQGQCNQGNSCRFRHSLAPSEFALLFHDAQPPLFLDFQPNVTGSPLTARRDVCKFYPLGKCKNGDICPYLHLPSAAPVSNALEGASQFGRLPCKHFVNSGCCSRGAQCLDLHDVQTTVATPLDNGGKGSSGGRWDNTETNSTCRYFRGGNCQYGVKCKYLHDAYTWDSISSNPHEWKQDSERKRWVGGESGEAERSRPCRWYPSGKCQRGDQCRYLHESPEADATDVDDHANGWDEASTPRDVQDGDTTHQEEPVANGWADDDGWGSNAPGWGNYVDEWNTGNINAGDARPDGKQSTSASKSENQDDTRSTGWNDSWGDQGDENSRKDSDGWHQDDGGWGKDLTNKFDPWAPSKDPCPFYARGNCKKGSRCNLPHNSPDNEIKDETPQKITSPTTSPPQTSPPPLNTTSQPTQTQQSELLEGHDNEVPTDELPVASPQLPLSTPECEGDETSLGPPLLNDDSSVGVTPPNYDAEQTWSTEWPSSIHESSMPPAKIEAPCKAFGQGHCPKGDSCRFQHIVLDADVELDRKNLPPEVPSQSGSDTVEQVDEGPRLAAGIAVQPEEPEELAVPERLLFNCTVQFGLDNGCSPINIVTASDTNYAVISNLPPDITTQVAVELINTVDETASLEGIQLATDEAKTDVLARFANPQHTDSVVTRLHAQTYDFRSLAAWKTREPPRRSLETIQSPLECRTVKVTWAAPSRSVWFYYTSITTAKKHAGRLNSGLIVDGRKIKAEFSRPRRSDQHFAVNVSGFHVLVDDDELGKLATTDAKLRHKNAPTYLGCPLNDIRNTLAARGSLERFFPLPMDPKSTQHVAFARFEDDLDAILLGVQNSAQAYLGGGALALQKVFHANYKVSNRRYQPVNKIIEQLAERAMQNKCTLDVYDAAEPVDIHLYAKAGSDTRFTFGSINRELDDTLQGITMMADTEGDDSVPVWDEYLAMPSSGKPIEKINCDTSFFVKVDMRRQVVRILGDEASCMRAQNKIHTLLKMVRAQRHSVPLDQYSIRMLMDGGYVRLRDELGAQKVILDLAVPELILLGDAEYKTFKATTPLLGEASSESSVVLIDKAECCFVCKRLPQSPIKLSCMHSYCTACLRYVLLTSEGTRFVPPRCLAGCDEYIPYTVVRDVLPMAAEESLLRNSFLAYVRAREDEFFFCPLPHCETVFRRLSEGRTGSVCYICISCETKLCALCGREYHEGIDCTVGADG